MGIPQYYHILLLELRRVLGKLVRFSLHLNLACYLPQVIIRPSIKIAYDHNHMMRAYYEDLLSSNGAQTVMMEPSAVE